MILRLVADVIGNQMQIIMKFTCYQHAKKLNCLLYFLGFAPILHLRTYYISYATNKFITHISTVTVMLTSAHLYINLQLPIGVSGINIARIYGIKAFNQKIIINFRGA